MRLDCLTCPQAYFTHDIGLPLTMTPDYETLSCTLTFGATPPSHDRGYIYIYIYIYMYVCVCIYIYVYICKP